MVEVHALQPALALLRQEGAEEVPVDTSPWEVNAVGARGAERLYVAEPLLHPL